MLGGQRDAQLARRGRTGERPRVHGGFLTGLREPGPGWHDPRWAEFVRQLAGSVNKADYPSPEAYQQAQRTFQEAESVYRKLAE